MSYKSPFKNKNLLISEIENFLKNYGSTFIQNAKKISTYFEICCYNYIIKYYENSNFGLKVENLENGSFKYKMGPAGYPENFSFFKITKTYKYPVNPKKFEYEVRQNVPVESFYDSKVYTTPDVVICKGGIGGKKDAGYYKGKRKYRFIPNKSLITFAEAKHYNPSPEMILNFIGIVNELMPSRLQKNDKTGRPSHIAPSLVVSGKGSYPTYHIKKSLENRYDVNIFLGVFSARTQIYSKKKKGNVIKI